MRALQPYCKELFYGRSQKALRAQSVMLALDLLIVAYFIATSFVPLTNVIIVIDALIGVLLIIELAGRVIADSERIALLTRPLVIVDVAVIASLFSPAVLGNFAFLRIVRAIRILRSYVVLRKLRKASRFFRRHEEVLFSALNLVVFIFLVSACVFVFEEERNPLIENYIDALYYTVTTLTTTGFGDIVLVGKVGRLLAVIIMLVGVILFVRLVQTIWRPSKVRQECPTCGLMRHDADAVHCKHCGHELHIRTEGWD
jgi:voltage-gated potassium channel